MKPDPTALVIDHEKPSRRLLRAVLEPQGYRVIEADDIESAVVKVVERKPDVIILEILLADGDGLELLRRLREWCHTPILVLSERGDDSSKVNALDYGANDYLTKPFSSAELLARLRVLRRTLLHLSDGPLLVDGNLSANLLTHQVTINGRPLKLTRKEEALFYVLAKYAGKVVSRGHLLRSIWGADCEERLHDLQVLVAQLRKKIEPIGSELFLTTEGHFGYRLAVSSSSAASVKR